MTKQRRTRVVRGTVGVLSVHTRRKATESNRERRGREARCFCEPLDLEGELSRYRERFNAALTHPSGRSSAAPRRERAASVRPPSSVAQARRRRRRPASSRARGQRLARVIPAQPAHGRLHFGRCVDRRCMVVAPRHKSDHVRSRNSARTARTSCCKPSGSTSPTCPPGARAVEAAQPEFCRRVG